MLKGQAIGLKRPRPIPTQECDAVRIRITESSAPVASLKFSGYLAPEHLIGVGSAVQENDIRSLPNYVKLEVNPASQFTPMHPLRHLEFPVSRDKAISGFVFTPAAGAPLGTPDRCSIEIRRGSQWEKVAEREFSNVKSNPVPQLIPLENVRTDRIRIRADHFLDGAEEMVFGEMGILLSE